MTSVSRWRVPNAANGAAAKQGHPLQPGDAGAAQAQRLLPRGAKLTWLTQLTHLSWYDSVNSAATPGAARVLRLPFAYRRGIVCQAGRRDCPGGGGSP